MPFRSDEQRKAMFANMKKRGGGSSPRQPRAPGTPRAPRTPGTPEPLPPGDDGSHGYMPGPGPTGGSEWHIADPQDNTNYFAPYGGPGNVAGQYEQEFHLTPPEALYEYQQSTTLGEQLYNLVVHGIDPSSINTIQPWMMPAPGQLTFMPLGPGPSFEYHFGANFHADGSLQYPSTVGGQAPGSNPSQLSPMFLNKKKKKKKK